MEKYSLLSPSGESDLKRNLYLIISSSLLKTEGYLLSRFNAFIAGF